MDPVSQMRASLLPILQVWEQELRRDFPDVTTNMYDHSVGALTDWNGHVVGIDCLLKQAAPTSPDNLALEVSLRHLHKAPSLDSADVVWGHPSGYVEASVLPAYVAFSSDHLAELVKRLPELFTALKQAIRQGRPSRDPDIVKPI
ncbi:hypothetical protein JQ604_26930 [Bradyrhizobium jicamae]|uniref:hypothetical protein n=1 Tax=Bradyrhizobium jicamae TaxID=280332 RepID=UPI001BA454AD|nr:hypothetical protein [Bradyrhizobium jicamae]MBR0755822.1 hypothetical protein [Bradyrhizobium jicamae]